jgi:K+-sensing histidine kinase KdpD
MPLKSAAHFDQLSSALGGVIVELAGKFAQEHDLPPMQAAGLDQMSTRLDDFAAELLMFGTDTWPESAASDLTEVTHEVSPSHVDPPRVALPCLVCTLGLAVASVALGAVALFTVGTGDYFTIAFAVLTAALFFGPVHALSAAGTATLLHNFFLVGTPLNFDVPSKVECTMVVFFLALAVATPWLARAAAKWRNRSLAISPNRPVALP